MTDYIHSFLDNYKSKIRNPFIGTMISVWLIRNWIVVFALFSFDKKRNMEWKITYISNYFAKIYFWSEFWSVIGIAFLSLILTFVLLGISRALTDFYYKVVEPFIVTKIDRKQIFTIADKDKLEARIEYLDLKLAKSIEAVSKAENVNQQLEQQAKDIEKENELKFKSIRNESERIKTEHDKLAENSVNIQTAFEQFYKIFNALNTTEKNLLMEIHANHRVNAKSNSPLRIQNLGNLLDKGFIKLDATKDTYELSQLGIVYMNGYMRDILKV